MSKPHPDDIKNREFAEACRPGISNILDQTIGLQSEDYDKEVCLDRIIDHLAYMLTDGR